MPPTINKAMPRGMPKPKAGQTLICESVAANTSYQTVHTVTAGKTFYVMGIRAHGARDTGARWTISFDGGTTANMVIHGIINYDSNNTAVLEVWTGYPIAQVAAEVAIQAKNGQTSVSNNITIWGWEE